LGTFAKYSKNKKRFIFKKVSLSVKISYVFKRYVDFWIEEDPKNYLFEEGIIEFYGAINRKIARGF
jgi:hypothetical protein